MKKRKFNRKRKYGKYIRKSTYKRKGLAKIKRVIKRVLRSEHETKFTRTTEDAEDIVKD